MPDGNPRRALAPIAAKTGRWLADDSGSPEPLSLTGSRDLTRDTLSRTGDCLRDGQRAPGGDRSVGSTI